MCEREAVVGLVVAVCEADLACEVSDSEVSEVRYMRRVNIYGWWVYGGKWWWIMTDY